MWGAGMGVRMGTTQSRCSTLVCDAALDGSSHNILTLWLVHALGVTRRASDRSAATTHTHTASGLSQGLGCLAVPAVFEIESGCLRDGLEPRALHRIERVCLDGLQLRDPGLSQASHTVRIRFVACCQSVTTDRGAAQPCVTGVSSGRSWPTRDRQQAWPVVSSVPTHWHNI